VLSAIALRVADDPFGKVKKMIKDLIMRLMEEAAEETSHKGWCDTELGTNENTRREKTEAVELLHAEIDQLSASITKLTEDIAALSKAVAELDAAMAEATSIRLRRRLRMRPPCRTPRLHRRPWRRRLPC
jgi:predicted RNase H-like nuclease (RuvC/YqgF family)